MKTIRTYNKACDYCGATGVVFTNRSGIPITVADITEVCPVCNGAKTITVTEEFEQPVQSVSEEAPEISDEEIENACAEYFLYKPKEHNNTLVVWKRAIEWYRLREKGEGGKISNPCLTCNETKGSCQFCEFNLEARFSNQHDSNE